jgi:hypothetical protein
LFSACRPAAAASGSIGNIRRPDFGCVVSKLRGVEGPLLPYVSVSNHRLLSAYDDPEEPAYLGPAYHLFSAVGPITKDLERPPAVSLERLEDRKAFLHSFDAMRKDVDNAQRSLEGLDSHQKQALEMIASTKVRDALDLNRESARLRAQYGNAGEDFLREGLQLAAPGLALRFSLLVVLV